MDDDFDVETVWVVMPTEGYLYETKVAFLDEDEALDHVEALGQTGVAALAQPIKILLEPPTMRKWWEMRTTIRRTGMIERRDLREFYEWSYEENPDSKTNTREITDPLGTTIVLTFGYNLDEATAQHDDKVRELGGFTL